MRTEESLLSPSHPSSLSTRCFVFKRLMTTYTMLVVLLIDNYFMEIVEKAKAKVVGDYLDTKKL
jgi:hypothetical protein